MKKISFTLFLISFSLFSCNNNNKSTANNMSNLEIIKSTYEGKSREERRKALQEHLANDATWTEAKGFPYAGTYIGFEGVMKNVFSKIGSEWIGYRFTAEDYVASEDKVIAFGTYSGTYKKTNKSFTARVAHVWTLKGGQIVSFEQIVDSKPVVDAMNVYKN